MSKEEVLDKLSTGLLTGDISADNLQNRKMEICGKYGLAELPKDSDILNHVSGEKRKKLKKVLKTAPVRSASGVSPVAIMTSPNMCPHGKCLYCPGGPASEFSSAQAYTGKEPASRRAKDEEYDPYGQVTRRLAQLDYNGHPIDKIELICMGGTMTARSHDYQEWFVKRALQAMNDYSVTEAPEHPNQESFAEENPEFKYLEDVIQENEHNSVKCIGITFETKPDWCGINQIDRMLNLGVTKVEVGVQTTYDEINQKMHRGHESEASKMANANLRDSGFKVGFHMMPGQPGMTEDMIRKDFKRLFENSEWRPDYLKIYPTLVVKGTRVYDSWKRGDFEPLTHEKASEIIADIKQDLPKYVRLQRVQRDIPADEISAGVQKSNLRQLAQSQMEEQDGSCDCIRCREVGLNEEEVNEDAVSLNVEKYEASGGTEHFISIDDEETNQLIGFVRLRFPNEPHREELKDASIVRELHVYGNQVALDETDSAEWQHKGFGETLMNKAEEISINAGYNKISVISGIGARQYYKKKLGYAQDGPYVSKTLE